MPSTNTDKLKGQRLGNQKVIERLIERLEENDKLQFEPTIVAIKNQLEIIRGLTEKIIALSDAESTPDELLDSQMYVFDMEAKLRRYRQNLRDHPSSSSTAVHDSSLSMSVLQPTESSYTRYRSVEEEPHASLQFPILPTPSEYVYQSSPPAFHQPRQVSTTIADTNIMQPAQQNVKHPTSGDTNTHNKPSSSESSNRSGAAHSRSRGRNKEQDARSTPQNLSEAMGGSGKPEKSTRESQSNIETVESCKTLRRDAESEHVAILKACAILQASSRSVGLSGVPRTPSMFSADYPKDPGVSLRRTKNGSYTTSGGTPQEHGVSLDNIPKPSVSSNRTPDGPIVSSNKTPENPGILSDHSQREIKKLSDYWSRQSPLAESSPRLRSNRKSLFNIKECLGKSSQSTPVRKKSRSHDCPEQTGNLTSENLPESLFPSTSSDSKSPSSRKWPETNHSKDQTTSEALNASVIPKSACTDVIQTPSKTRRRQNGKSSINDNIISCKIGNTYMQFETTAHLLHGRRLTGLPYSDAKAVGDCSFPNVTRRGITQRAQARVRLIEQYRHRWTHEYLTSLREFQTKGGNNHQTIRLGDVVIVQDDFKPRLQWTLAVVDELLTGNDGLTRAARLRTSGGITTRPIVKLYPLEVHCDDN